MIGIGIGIPFRRGGVSIDAQAQAHYDRVIADNGVIPKGLAGCSAFFTAVKAVYNVTDINTAVAAAYDPDYLGYKLGAGSGATLGQAAQKLYSCCGVSGDLIQTTAASQPLLLEHSGSNYFFCSGVVGNYCSTPQATANEITGDIDIRAYINTSSTKADKCIVGSGNDDTPNYLFRLDSSRRLEYWAFGGYGSLALSDSLTSGDLWVRCTRSGNTVTFYTSTDSVDTNINSINWVQLGSPVTYTNTGTFVNSELWVGNFQPYPSINSFQNAIYRVAISNTVGGSPVVDFNPASYNASVSQTQWTSATGEVWSIITDNSTTDYKGKLVDRSVIQGDGIDDSITNSIANNQPYTEYIAHNRFGNGNIISKATGNSLSHNANDYILNNGAALNLANSSRITQIITTRNNDTSSGLAINNGTETTGNAGSNNGTNMAFIQGNISLNTYIVSLGNDSNAVRLAIYNYIRQINLY